MSRPSRGAWIEIFHPMLAVSAGLSRAPRGARGLKSDGFPCTGERNKGRAPRGARGLKYTKNSRTAIFSPVAPLAGRVD